MTAPAKNIGELICSIELIVDRTLISNHSIEDFEQALDDAYQPHDDNYQLHGVVYQLHDQEIIRSGASQENDR
jgi:hypothetical protein